jgi:hypothetical protein
MTMMPRAVVASLVLFAFQGPAATAPALDLSGSWTLADDARPGVLGRAITLRQTDTALTIDGPGAASETYTLNGETRKTFPPNTEIASKDPATTLWAYATSRVSVSGWQAGELVIVTHQLSQVNSPNASPRRFEAEWTRRLRLSLDAAGRLIAESTVIIDPLPQASSVRGERVDALVPQASVYVRVVTR